MTQAHKRLFSGIQPTGNLHLGNYLGAVQQWTQMQVGYDAVFCIVDLHAITVDHVPEDLTRHTYDLVRTCLASGIDPERATLFVQSQVAAHTELMWVLSAAARMGDMEKMTQFKDKSARDGAERASVGLFSYPILMAADILLYGAHVVPVGEDQVQHVELARTLARRFNARYGETFVVPEVRIATQGKRIMGLDDPTKKMSKSAESIYNYIALTDDPDLARKKIMKAVTDSGADITYTSERPAVANLINIYSLLSGRSPEEIVEAHAGQGFGDFKRALADVVVGFLTPFQERVSALSEDDVRTVIARGQGRAQERADRMMHDVRAKIGFVS